MASQNITPEIIGEIYRGLLDLSVEKADLIKTFIGTLSNRSINEVTFTYIHMHLYDFDDLQKRIAEIDPLELDKEILNGHINFLGKLSKQNDPIEQWTTDFCHLAEYYTDRRSICEKMVRCEV